MKLRLLIAFALVFILMMTGCTGEDDTLEPLEGVERDSQETEEEGYKEVNVADNSDSNVDGSLSENKEENAIQEEDTEISVVDEDPEENESEVNSEENESTFENEADQEVIQDEYAVLDLSQPEDPDNYTSSLVFIRQEDDIWRVVDRTGRVLRVFSSYDGAKPGIVNNGATVEVKEGIPSVSIIRDYTSYDNAYVLETDPEALAENFSKALLEAQKAVSGKSQISEYTLKSAQIVETIGKGIVKIQMTFDVLVDTSMSDSPWGSGSVENIVYDYTLYGYETTWILPVKEPLYNSVPENESASQEEREEADVSNDSSDTDSNESDSSESDTNNDNQAVDETDDESHVIVVTDLKVDIGELKGVTVFYEKVLLPQSEAFSGTDIYEHNVNLKLRKDGIESTVVKGEKNGTYEWLAGYDSKAYLFNQIHVPASEVVYSGISMVNIEDGAYRTIYNGAVAKGVLLDDRYYVFGNDNLFEINLVNNSLRIAAVLPMHLDFSQDSLRVVEMKDQIMTLEITDSDSVTKYEINVSNGEMKEITP